MKIDVLAGLVLALGLAGCGGGDRTASVPLAQRVQPLAAPTSGNTRPLDLTLTLPDAAGRCDGQFQLQGCRDSACTLPVVASSFSYIAFREVGGTAAQGGTVIALQQGPLRVQARNAADGRLLWSYQPLFNVQWTDSVFVSAPLLTDNLVFISTEVGVYALSRADGRPGSLALSAQGVLTIAHPGLPGQGGGVTAINLQ